ncbi:type 1 glutamine amidotransferase domain-containing protein [Kitasatospora sp. NPDC088391]|uniref:type 1 glutamine amidotransferase domain-containing protein n=1 Tax=Kitasatospora sp. NPDC088391 TaxID=3364074 RepID=UPI00381A1409
MPRTDTVLIVLTSHDTLGDTGRPTGYFLPELAHPWQVFEQAGRRVELVSTRGGRPPHYGDDPADPVLRAFAADTAAQAALDTTPTPDRIDPARYDAVLYAGGHGTMWDFPDDPGLQHVARAVHEAGGVVAALCHGPAGLLEVRLSDGTRLIEGRNVAGFTDEEEAAVGLTGVVPFSLQEALELRGAKHLRAAAFRSHVVVDGRLVTGQNPASAADTARAVVDVLDGRR